MPLWLYLSALLSAFIATPPQASIRPLFDEAHDVVCTVNSINGQIGLWLTANHCKGVRFVGQEDEKGEWHYHTVSLVYANETEDIAVLFTDTLRVTPLRLSNAEPVVDDSVTMMGFPLGFTQLQRVHGTVSNILTHVVSGDVDYGWKTMYDMGVCGGNSGSVVLNASGEVIGVMQLGPGQPCAPFAGGIPYVKLSALVGRFFER